ncbi:MAG: peptigoglycan-binding protein LysM [Chloroflexi bacterium]|nr:MAG: peptigoglycan-binding protein LysM [Chloroflexota bacterium]
MALEFATLTNLDTGDRAEALFNPNEYSLNKDNNYAQVAVPGLGSPLLQFVHGNLRTLDMELFFDSYEQHRHGSRVLNQAQDDVRKLTQPVVDLLAINPDTHAPPKVLFNWGGLAFKGVLAKVSQRFTMFLDNGIPIRARLSVTVNEYKTAAEEAKEVKRQTADFTRAYRVADGETVSAIAGQIYRDATKWRPIAIASRLEDPRRLPTGLLLTIPPLPYRDPDNGQVYA